MKRVVVFVILFSMVLHCSIRLGFVTWLYQNRQAIAYSIGIGDEPPITMCSHADDLDRAVTIDVSETHHDNVPVNSFYATEINLFLVKEISKNNPEYSLLRESQLPKWIIGSYTPPSFDIFHPPA